MREDTIAELLMGAAAADGELVPDEVEGVRAILRKALRMARLPAHVEACISVFAPARFSLERAVAELGLATDADKRHLLELVAAVRDLDGIHDLEEDAFLGRLATALGLPRAVWSDLVLDVEELPAATDALLGKGPPPLPRR